MLQYNIIIPHTRISVRALTSLETEQETPYKEYIGMRAAVETVLRRRALQCSFSSVFHVKSANNSYKEGKKFEKIFVNFVGGPMVVMGFIGAVEFVRRRKFSA